MNNHPEIKNFLIYTVGYVVYFIGCFYAEDKFGLTQSNMGVLFVAIPILYLVFLISKLIKSILDKKSKAIIGLVVTIMVVLVMTIVTGPFLLFLLVLASMSHS